MKHRGAANEQTFRPSLRTSAQCCFVILPLRSWIHGNFLLRPCPTWFCSVSVGPNDDEASTERNVATVSPIPKIVTTAIQEDASRDEEDCRDEWGKTGHP